MTEYNRVTVLETQFFHSRRLPLSDRQARHTISEAYTNVANTPLRVPLPRELCTHTVPIQTARLHKRGRKSDRKSTRLNSSHSQISYAVFCLKKKKNIKLNLEI